MRTASILREIIENRRTTKPDRFTGEVIPEPLVREVLESANWAPTHGFTEPWRFTIWTGDGKSELVDFLIQWDESRSGRNEVREEKRKKSVESSSHIIGIGMKRGENPKIPFLEEVCSVAMAVQNMWLTAHSLGLSGYWSTGEIGWSDELRDLLGLGEEDQAMGFFYLGKSAIQPLPGRRITTIDDKTKWVGGQTSETP